MRQTSILLLSLTLLTSACYAQDKAKQKTTLRPMKPKVTDTGIPHGNISITGFFRYDNYAPQISLKSDLDALVTITIRDSDGIIVGKGKVQLEKGIAKSIEIDEEHGGLKAGSPTYDIQLSAQYFELAPTVTETSVPAPSVSVWYAMATKPEKVTQITDVSKPWILKIAVNRAGYANLIFDDDQNLIPSSVKKEYAASGDLNKHFDIDLNFFRDGYYRYHIEGGSNEDNLALAGQSESFLLVIDTKPALEGLLKLEIKPDTGFADLSFQLSQKISTDLEFPGGFSVRVIGQGEKPPFTYNQSISTDSSAIIRKLTGAGSAAATKTPEPMQLILKAASGPHMNEQIAEISLQGMQGATTAATIAKLSAIKGTLKSADATNAAKEALGLQNQDSSKDPQASAVQYLAGLLTQKNSNKDKLLAFLTVAGNVALTYYGVPAKIPTRTN